MEPILDKIDVWVEAATIRFLHILRALKPKKTPELCPPKCSEGHTYRWPCRARIRKPVKSNVGAYRVIGTWDSIEETPEGLVATGQLREEVVSREFTERLLQSEAHHGAPEQELCLAKGPGGWGSIKTCSFKKGHEKQGYPHSWVVT